MNTRYEFGETMASSFMRPSRRSPGAAKDIHQTRDPEEAQQRLTRKHMPQLRETMRMRGGETHGKCMCGH